MKRKTETNKKLKSKRGRGKGYPRERGLRAKSPLPAPAPILEDKSLERPAVAAPPSALPAPISKAPDASERKLGRYEVKIVGDGRRSKGELIADGALMSSSSALVAMNFARLNMSEADLDASGLDAFLKVTKAKAAAVAEGDMSGIEATLVAQIISLNAMANNMLSRGQMAMGQSLAAMETYMRLGLKAQAQARATAETLVEIKNPRPIFARNFNAVAGNQQVNNAAGPQQVNNGAAGIPSRARETALLSNELLEPDNE
jgi:hypothetical protein